MQVPQSVGWFGKLPWRGDFVGHGLPHACQRAWDDWLQLGLAEAQRALGDQALHDRLRAMPPWQWLLRADGPAEPIRCGVLVPSHDRVGRRFPLVFAEAYDAGALTGVALAALQRRALALCDGLHDVAQAASLQDFEQVAAAIAATPWPADAAAGAGAAAATVGELFASLPAAASFWWCAEPVANPLAPIADDWPPRAALLAELLRPPA